MIQPSLTQQQVEEARELRRTTNMPYHKLALLYGVSAKTIYQFINDPTRNTRSDN